MKSTLPLRMFVVCSFLLTGCEDVEDAAKVVVDSVKAIGGCSSGASGLTDEHREILEITGWDEYVYEHIEEIRYVNKDILDGTDNAVGMAYCGRCYTDIATGTRKNTDIAIAIVHEAAHFEDKCENGEPPAVKIENEFRGDLNKKLHSDFVDMAEIRNSEVGDVVLKKSVFEEFTDEHIDYMKRVHNLSFAYEDFSPPNSFRFRGLFVNSERNLFAYTDGRSYVDIYDKDFTKISSYTRPTNDSIGNPFLLCDREGKGSEKYWSFDSSRFFICLSDSIVSYDSNSNTFSTLIDEVEDGYGHNYDAHFSPASPNILVQKSFSSDPLKLYGASGELLSDVEIVGDDLTRLLEENGRLHWYAQNELMITHNSEIVLATLSADFLSLNQAGPALSLAGSEPISYVQTSSEQAKVYIFGLTGSYYTLSDNQLVELSIPENVIEAYASFGSSQNELGLTVGSTWTKRIESPFVNVGFLSFTPGDLNAVNVIPEPLADITIFNAWAYEVSPNRYLALSNSGYLYWLEVD